MTRTEPRPAPATLISQFRRDPAAQAAYFLAAPTLRSLVLDVHREDDRARLLREVSTGLADPRQKWIPPTYFYDERGSLLFEEITSLPEYYLTRGEESILRRVVPDLARQLQPEQLVELGSGSSAKTRLFFDAYDARQQALTYAPIDVSRSMLQASAEQLQQEYGALRVLGLAGQYEDALAVLPPAANRLIFFLGGTIGNFTEGMQAQFFSRLVGGMERGNHLLLGYDRQPHPGKPVADIVAAYNDHQGVTAAFNLNLLTRLNRDLGMDFHLPDWSHRAVYDDDRHRIEMHLVSRCEQVVTLPAGGRSYRFAPGESILTEISRRFDPQGLADWLAEFGLQRVGQWSDDNAYFGLILLRLGRGGQRHGGNLRAPGSGTGSHSQR